MSQDNMLRDEHVKSVLTIFFAQLWHYVVGGRLMMLTKHSSIISRNKQIVFYLSVMSRSVMTQM